MPPPLPAGEVIVNSNSLASRSRQINDIKLSPTLSRLRRFGHAKRSDTDNTNSTTATQSGRYLSPPRSKLANRLEELSRSGRNPASRSSRNSTSERLKSRRQLKKQYSSDEDFGSSPSASFYDGENSLLSTNHERRKWRNRENRLRISVENNSSDEGLHLGSKRSDNLSRTNSDEHRLRISFEDNSGDEITHNVRKKSSDSSLKPDWKTSNERSRRGSIPKSASDSVITCPLNKKSSFLNHIRKPGWTGLICQIPVSVYSTSSGFEIYVDYDETEILRTVKEHLTKR